MRALPFVVFFMTMSLALPGALGLEVKLLANTDVCTYHPETGKDFCYSTYEIMDTGTLEPGKIAFKYKTDKKEAFFSLVSGLEATFSAQKSGSKMILNITAWKNPFLNVDNVPCIDGECFYEYAWWNSSMTRWPVTKIDNVSNPFLVNDSFGLNIGGGLQFIWCSNSTKYIYNDSLGKIYCTDDDIQVPTFIDEGNGTDYGTPEDKLISWFHLNGTYDSGMYDYPLAGNATRAEIAVCKIGHCYNFSSVSNQYLESGDQEPNDIGWSIMAWFKHPSTGTIQSILYKYNGNPYYSIDIIANGSISVSYRSASGTEINWNGANASDNLWHHIAWTINKVTNLSAFYLDGNKVGGAAAAFPISGATTLHIGVAHTTIHTQYFSGLIDEIMIYNRTLPDAEITSIYNNTSPNAYSDLGGMESYAAPPFYATSDRYCFNETHLFISEPCIDNCSSMSIYLMHCDYGCQDATFWNLFQPGCEEPPAMLMIIGGIILVIVILIITRVTK